MSRAFLSSARNLVMCGLIFGSSGVVVARQNSTVDPPTTNTASLIDLSAALRLAGARNLDVLIAQESLNESRANRDSAFEQFVPFLSAGLGYHRRDGMAQAVPAGTISATHFQSYSPGVTIVAQIPLGEALYQSLAAKQLVRASDHALESQRQEALRLAAQGFFDLARARTLAAILDEAARISEEYQRQVREAVAAGIAFKGDELRVRTQTEGYLIAWRQALEQQTAASIALAQVLHLDPAVELTPADAELLPLALFPTNVALHSLVERALNSRPELRQSEAVLLAARDAKRAAAYGPLFPALGAQIYLGGLGGGHDDGPSDFGDSEDYMFGLAWRIGPGGLLDFGRVKAANARLSATQLGDAKLKDLITSQVVSALNRVRSLSDQIGFAQRSVVTAAETLRLTRDRKLFGVGAVLEDIQAQQDVVRARSGLLNAITEFNKAQYALNQAVGGPAEVARSPAP